MMMNSDSYHFKMEMIIEPLLLQDVMLQIDNEIVANKLFTITR